jgi:ABC-type transport system involved in cytochrome c biogenesis ATPase subunit
MTAPDSAPDPAPAPAAATADRVASGAPALLQAEALAFDHPGRRLFGGLSFAVTPGLTLVRGGDGRGKSTLLRLMAGELAPAAGVLQRAAPTVFLADPRDARDDPLTGLQWVQAQARRCAGWEPAVHAALLEGFALGEHVPKELFRLSTGTRRKLWLSVAFASGAAVTLLDAPFAALDGPARDLLCELLEDAADHPRRAWVVADYALPSRLAALPLAATIDLGD